LELTQNFLEPRYREPRGFGFVQYYDPEDAADAKYYMDGQMVLGRQITVVFAEENRKKPQEMRARDRVRFVDSSQCDYYTLLLPRMAHCFSTRCLLHIAEVVPMTRDILALGPLCILGAVLHLPAATQGMCAPCNFGLFEGITSC
jgi:RNA recognition motif-containing protein